MYTRPKPEALAVSYQRSANFERRVRDAFRGNRVNPHWIGNSNNFWYRTTGPSGTASFIFVDSKQGIRRPAFDHERLLKALAGCDAKGRMAKLPFSWIDPSEDGESVKFRVRKIVWEFRSDGLLTEYDGEINEETLRPIQEEKPSELGGSDVLVTFLNRMMEPLSISWIDYDGNAQFYDTVEPGNSSSRQTYVGHVWRVSRSGKDGGAVIFKAKSSDSIAVIETETFSPKTLVEESSESKHLLEVADSSVHTESSGIKQPSLHPFVKDYNVWVRDSSAREIQLSTSGTNENPFDGDCIYQSSDDRFTVVWQYKPDQDHQVYQVESSPKDQVQPRLKQFQYLKPGDKVRIDMPRMFDLAKQREIKTDDSLFQNPYDTEDMGWSTDGREYYFLYNQRGHRVLRVLGMDIEGHVRVLIEETSKTFIDYSQKNYFHRVENSDELIWASERDGWNHIYLVDLKRGTTINQITKGKWLMRSVDRVDEKKRQILFTAFGVVEDQDPYYAHLARVNFDGSDFELLTEGNGTHTWNWSPDRNYFIDTWSRVDSAPQTVLRNGQTGEQVVELEVGNLEKLLKAGWTPAERFEAPGRDGKSMIYGIITKPSDLDVSKKYPVIEKIYAGPSGFSVPKAFSTMIEEHELAELGFIVVQIDGMGTNWRSKDFHDHCYKDLKDAGLPDRIAWMKAASVSRPWMDLSRVGIYGGSAGGQNAMSAMLWHGDFYKAAVADCGCHDNRMDKIWWNEQYMGWPIDQSYEDCSNVVHAKRLTGALMLILGELDDNVDPASTMQVVNALNEAGKDYDLLFIPGGGHCVGSSSQYATRRQRDFFIRHLIGVELPDRNKESTQ